MTDSIHGWSRYQLAAQTQTPREASSPIQAGQEISSQLTTNDLTDISPIQGTDPTSTGRSLNEREWTLISNPSPLRQLVAKPLKALYREILTQWHLWTEFARLTPSDTRIVYHALLDKAHLGDKFDSRIGAGMLSKDASRTIAEALSGALSESWAFRGKAMESVRTRLIRETLPNLRKFGSLDPNISPLHEALQRVMGPSQTVQKIEKLKEGESLLVSFGSEGHATALKVQRMDGETVRLVLYNTGDGLEHHAQWLNNDRLFQTFLIIDGVPLENVLSSENWETAFSLRHSAETMEPVYEFFKDTLGKDGRVVPPSTERVDYERIQEGGTCSFQSLTAMLRHQIMEDTQGTSFEKLAAYKLIKNYMLREFVQKYRTLDKTVKQALKTPVKKLNAELALAELAADPISFASSTAILHQYLKDKGSGWEQIASTIAGLNSDSPLEKYFILREYSVHIATLWTLYPDMKPKNPDPAFQLAVARAEHWEAIRLRQQASSPKTLS